MHTSVSSSRHVGSDRLVSALVLLLAAVALAAPAALPSDSQKKAISIETPSGSFRAQVDSQPGRLGLPLYPGAKLMKGEDSSSLDVSLEVPGKPLKRLAVAKFITPDRLEVVRDFYKEKLGKSVTKFTPKDDDGGVSFEVESKSEGRYVQLKSTKDGTEIDLVRVEGLNDEGSK